LFDVPEYSNTFDYIKDTRPAVYFNNQKNHCISSLRTVVSVWSEISKGRIFFGEPLELCTELQRMFTTATSND